MSTELRGAALFDAAARTIGKFQAMPSPWLFDAKWSLVPAMLEWLRERDRLAIYFWESGRVHALMGTLFDEKESGPDLPTALARLVLRVAELEGKS